VFSLHWQRRTGDHGFYHIQTALNVKTPIFKWEQRIEKGGDKKYAGRMQTKDNASEAGSY